MNTSNIKKYAPVARKQFRDAVMQKLTTLGIEADKKGNLQISQATDLGDSVRYGQFTLEKSLTARRERLVKRAEKQGYEVLVEHIAYTWFNRFCAIRYMELHGYLDHGFRMLSHTNPTLEGGFEVLDHVPEVADALGLDKSRLVEMKIAGDRDEELYRELLLAQCHALHGAMPFLFEAVNDDIELVLPDNLTRTDSILRGLVDEKAMPKEDWDQIEVIGWLYQFYISEKKDDVIGKVVKSEDIPAATQLFTPNWIVQYLVQNSVGRQWLQTYPDSSLKGKMPYYIEPAEQTPEVQAQLAAITPSSIEPESIKVLDPACGSGHILTEAYNVLKVIYEERGYRTRDIPQLILENNIFGLDIDDRAAQLSGFAMLMLARQDDRRILTRSVRLNIVSLQESKLDIAELWSKLNFHQQAQRGSMGDMFAEGTTLANTDSAEYKLLMRTLALFTSAKTLGSLIQVPQEDEAALKAFLDGLHRLAVEGDNQQKEAAAELIPYIHQAWILAQRYDAVVANPPYMGSGYFNKIFKSSLSSKYKLSRTDLYVLFMERNLDFLANENSAVSMITRQDWMFTSSYSDIRNRLAHECSLSTLAHLGSGAFPSISGEVVQAVMYIYGRKHIKGYKQIYIDCTDDKTDKETSLFDFHKHYKKTSDSFPSQIGSPFLYQLSKAELDVLSSNEQFGNKALLREGIHTGDNNSYVRSWWEVDYSNISRKCSSIENFDATNKRWLPYNKGGTTTRWYESSEFVIAFDKITRNEMDKINGHVRPSQSLYFKEGGTWSDVATKGFGVRFYEAGHLFDGAGPVIISSNIYFDLGIMNSLIFRALSAHVMPNLHFKCGTVKKMPYPEFYNSHHTRHKIETISRENIKICKSHCTRIEIFIDFLEPLTTNLNTGILRDNFIKIKDERQQTLDSMNSNECELNELATKSYNLDINSHEAISDNNTVLVKYQGSSVEEMISYIIGCQMGRYSLDREGLVYAHEGNKGFAEIAAESAYKTFPADQDGILPLMDSDWFDDDVTARVKEFVRTVWGEEHLQENLDFIAESLCLYAIKPKKGESSLDTIRRYLSTQFWKDHMKMYKKRPIYWLFSSGKEKAFECMVYLHRYNDATLSRMRTEYVVPLLARYQGNIDLVSDELKSAESGAATTRLKKELDGLSKKFNELRSFDDRLRHYADMRITIDLDNGVKDNYGKFGDLLADVKAITGSAPEEI
ncbi:BREX-1 system adenine-specific DNA-methyltransferase PglX [Rahnella inusitata]|uniref:BREX-1 system adenine-specific DNA-methyltransferase PglX n=1 Tax=Rahnella inusitata TaxID=58169 RepID=UPI0039BDDADE